MAKLTRKGTKSNDTFFGTSRDEAFFGFEGNDYFYGSKGADDYDGGLGTDTVNYYASSSGVTVYLHHGYGKTGDAKDDTYTGIENIVGSNYNDYIYGDNADNLLNGRNGDDRLYGGNGNDQLIGGNGVDRLYGGSHADTLSGGNDNDYLYGGSGNDTLTGGRGADYIHGGSGIDTVSYSSSSQGVTVSLDTGFASGGDAAGDTLRYVENITGSYWYADTLKGNIGDNVLDGQRGDDVFIGTGGDDTIIGGFGDDTLDYSGLDRSVRVDLASGIVDKSFLGDDTVSGIETVIGTAGFDTFRGSSGDDAFFGGHGADRFHGSAGADHFDGGDDVDAAHYFDSSSRVIVDLTSGEGHSGDAEGDTFVAIEDVYGSRHDDQITGNDQANTISGGDGNDILHGHGGDDTLVGSFGFDTIIAGSGDDYISADQDTSHSADYIDGGIGFDTVTYRTPYDGDGIELIVDLAAGTSSDGDTLINVEGVLIQGDNAVVSGDELANHFQVYGYGNEFNGRGGQDRFVADNLPGNGPLTGNIYDGGAGIDWIDYSSGRLAFFSGEGVEVDLEDGSAVDLNFLQHPEDQIANIENVIGTAQDDRIFGDDQTNVVFGGAGDDLINGRGGSDVLYGGIGEDTFVFDHRDSGEGDIVIDFVIGEDRLDLSNTEINNLADLQNADDGDYFRQSGTDVVIHSSDEDTITLVNTRIIDLVSTPDIFIF